MRSVLYNIKLIFAIAGVICILYVAFLHWRKRRQKPQYDVEVEAAKVVYAAHERAFEEYFNLWLTNRDKFFAAYGEKFRNVTSPNLLSFLSIITAFGGIEKLFYTIDWRGEENEHEIEKFFLHHIGKTITWTNAYKIRSDASRDELRDGKFIIRLFHELDKDLQAAGYTIVFKDTNSDSYRFTVLRKGAVERLKLSSEYFLVKKLK